MRGRQEKRIPAPSKSCCCSTPLHLLRRLDSKGGKSCKAGKRQICFCNNIYTGLLRYTQSPRLGVHLLSHFLKTAAGLMQTIKSLQPESSRRQEWAELHCQQIQTDGMGRCALTSFLWVFVNWEHWKVSTREWGRGWTASVLGRRLKHTEQMAKLI